jgi:hypothetical protein
MARGLKLRCLSWPVVEEGMSERFRVLGASLLGGVIGGALGYLCFTSDGRRFLDELEPKLDRFANEVRKLRRSLAKVKAIAAEGRRSLDDVMNERPRTKEWPTETPQHARPA